MSRAMVFLVCKIWLMLQSCSESKSLLISPEIEWCSINSTGLNSASLPDFSWEKARRLWRMVLPWSSRKIQAAPLLLFGPLHEDPMLHLTKHRGGLDHRSCLSRLPKVLCVSSNPGKLIPSHTYASSCAFERTDIEEYGILSKARAFFAFQ